MSLWITGNCFSITFNGSEFKGVMAILEKRKIRTYESRNQEPKNSRIGISQIQISRGGAGARGRRGEIFYHEEHEVQEDVNLYCL